MALWLIKVELTVEADDRSEAWRKARELVGSFMEQVLECSICTDPVFSGHTSPEERAYRCRDCGAILCHPCATEQGCMCGWRRFGEQYAVVQGP